jgi:hypothetical protein
VNGWLIDTDVVSELGKPNCDTNVDTWVGVQPEDSFFVSVATIAELKFGIRAAPNVARRRQLQVWLDTVVRPWFGTQVLPIDEPTMMEWLALVESGRKVGHNFPQPDLFLAASARTHDLCIVTGNVAHFSPAGVVIFNPWLNVLERPGHKPRKINGLMTLDQLP